MSGLLKKQGWKVLNALGLGGAVTLSVESALKQYGWFRSFKSGESVDAQGNPIPWYTYTFIFFLEPRLKPNFEVFEYGSGNSTRWYAARVKKINAVEHDADWIKKISAKVPSNATIIGKELGPDYIEAIAGTGQKYQMIIVDGRKRVKCVAFSADYLAEDGVLILDNSERPWYQEAKDLMERRGYKRLDFKGPGPVIGYEFCSSVFYKDGNCLGI